MSTERLKNVTSLLFNNLLNNTAEVNFDEFKGKDCLFEADWSKTKGLHELCPLFKDFSTLQEHQITEGSRLHLSVRKSGHGASSGNPEDFFGLLREVIRGHFSEQDTERVMQKFKEDFKTWVWSLSLDDIERMAALHLNESTESASC